MERAPEGSFGSKLRQEGSLAVRMEKLEADLLRVKGVMVKMSEQLGGAATPTTPAALQQSPASNACHRGVFSLSKLALV